jgi:hypothetical protein
LEDFEHNGEKILASRLGYRINHRFVRRFLGRIFDNPTKVFDESLLCPETQDPEAFADGIKYVTQAHQQVARNYLDDASIDEACPPLRALIHIMAHGQFDGMGIADSRLRGMFTREYLLSSDWYRARLAVKQERDKAMWRRHADYVERYMAKPGREDIAERLGLAERRSYAAEQFASVQSEDYLAALVGTLGANPM